jgi:hypothetical protein
MWNRDMTQAEEVAYVIGSRDARDGIEEWQNPFEATRLKSAWSQGWYDWHAKQRESKSN